MALEAELTIFLSIFRKEQTLKIAATSWKKLVDKLEQVETEEAIVKEKVSQAGIDHCPKIHLSYSNNQSEGSLSHATDTGKLGEGEIAKKHKQRHCK